MITGKNYIGNSLEANGSVTFQTFNPQSNSHNSWVMTEVSSKELQRALTLAESAFKVYRKYTGEQRAAFLDKIADEIEGLGQELLDTFCAESGLPQGRAEGERGRTIFQLRSFAALLRDENWPETSIDLAQPERQPLPKVDLRKTSIPLGPVAVFGSSNFPFAYSTAGGDTASALAAGCPVVVKSHPMHAGTGELVAGAIIRAAEATGMPNGVFSNLNSKGIEIGVQLVQHPSIKAVGFTGSIKGGRALFDLGNARPEPIPVFAEMGSINPVVICSGALKEKAASWAKSYADSIALGAGQFCTNPGLLLAVESDDLDRFSKELSSALSALPAGCMLHPDIHAAFERLKQNVSTQMGVTVTSTGQQGKENYTEPVLAQVSGAQFLQNPNLHQEVFGPFSLLVRCKDEEELLQIIEGLEGQLTGTILAEPSDYPHIGDLIDILQQRVGRLIFNGVPTGVEVCPSMQHGGPYPASTDVRFTAVGVHAILRWIRPIAYQNFPPELLPKELQV